MTLQRFIERLIWLCMLPLIVMGTVLLLLHLHTLKERRQMLADSVVRTAARSMDQMLEVRLASLHLLARMLDQGMALQNGQLDRSRAYQIALEFVALHGHHVLICSSEHRMLINTRVPLDAPLPHMPRPTGESAVAVALVTKTAAVGDMFMGPLAHKPMVALAMPLQTDSRDPLVLLSTIETDQLRERMQGFRLPEGWALRVVDSQGQEMLRTQTQRVVHSKGASPQATVLPTRGAVMVSSLADDQPGDQDGSWRTASLINAPWTVGLRAPPVSPLDDAGVQAILLLGTLGAAVGVAYLGGSIAAGRLTQAMASLTRAVPIPQPGQDIDEVARVRGELRRLARRREALQDAERRRIGLELHDDLQQKLAVLKHDIHQLVKEPRPLHASPPTDTDERLERALGLLDEAIESTHRLVRDLRPPILDDLGLPLALQVMADEHRRAHGQHVDLQLVNPERFQQIPEDVATALYRLAQEALNNVRKHSRAGVVDLTLDCESDGTVVLEICDDGKGFDPERAQRSTQGNGLRGMHERVQSLSGELSIISQPGQGTAILVRIPPGESATLPQASSHTAF